MQKYVNYVQTRGGAAVQQASVLVKTLAGATATIYSDDGSTETDNPLTTDANGKFEFYAADGRYSLTISKTGVITQQNITDILLEDPEDGFAELDDAGSLATTNHIAVAQSGARKKTLLSSLADWIIGTYEGFAPSGIATSGHRASRTVQAKLSEFVVSVLDAKNSDGTSVAGDNTQDDTTGINRALDGGTLIVDLGAKTYKVTDTITVQAGVTAIGRGATLKVAEDWANKPVVILEDGAKLVGVTVEETNASATNATKDQASNIGIAVRGSDVEVRDCHTIGFNVGFAARDDASAARDEPRFIDCTATLAYSWGFETDSVKNAKYVRCRSYTNGLDGFKAQNESTRTCDDLTYDTCHAYDNGQRDTQAGGAESTNGNGFDVFHGGYRLRMAMCRAYANYGSGYNIKSDSASQVPMGESTFVACKAIGNLWTSGGHVHGFELGTGGEAFNSWMTFIGCLSAENEGDGVLLAGGYGIKFIGLLSVKNKRFGVNDQAGADVKYIGCDFVRNTEANARVGTTDSDAWLSKRSAFKSCTFSASFDQYPADNATSWTAAKEEKTFTADASTDTLTSTAHGFSNNDKVRFWTFAGTLPTGISTSTSYWVANVTANTFQIKANKDSGSVVNITANGSGTLIATRDSAYGVRVHSDSADILIEDCSFSNHWDASGQAFLSGKRVRLVRPRFYKGNSSVVTVTRGEVEIHDLYSKDLELDGSATDGGIQASSGQTNIYGAHFERTGVASGWAVRFLASSTGGYHERVTADNFSATVVISAGATMKPGGTSARKVLTTAVNLNSAGAEKTITGLPAKYIVRRVSAFDASTSLAASAATVGVFTATASGGTTVVADTTLTGLTAASKFVDLTVATSADYLTASTLYITTGTAHGSTATCSVQAEIEDLT